MPSWAGRSPYCIGLNVCLGTFASFDHSVLYFPMLFEGSINWHFTRVTPSGKYCQCSPLLVSALSTHPFSIAVHKVLEPIPALLITQVTRGQEPGHNHWHLYFHTCRQSRILGLMCLSLDYRRKPEENPHRQTQQKTSKSTHPPRGFMQRMRSLKYYRMQFYVQLVVVSFIISKNGEFCKLYTFKKNISRKRFRRFSSIFIEIERRTKQ